MRHRSTRRGRQYAAIPNSSMRDEALSIEARGMLALLMTYADDWSFNRDHLMKVAQIGRDKFQRIMRELIAAGYVDREAVRGESGQVSGSTWIINDAPDREPENPAVGDTEGLINRQPEKPTAGFSGPLRRPTEKKTKREECVCPDHEAAFDRFWKIHPRSRDRERTRKLFLIAVSKGFDPEVVLAAAAAYRRENLGNRPMYLCYSDNWLDQGRWKELEAEKPTQDTGDGTEGTLNLHAQRIKDGRKPFGLSDAQRDLMLSREMVTADELRRVGIRL